MQEPSSGSFECTLHLKGVRVLQRRCRLLSALIIDSIDKSLKMLRPLRSVLYMPSSNARALEKSFSIRADGFIYDLEDAVSPDMKKLAREQAVEASKIAYEHFRMRREQNKKTPEIIIRVNGRSTTWFQDDLHAVVKDSAADAVLLPKTESCDDVKVVEEVIKEDQEIWCMIETPLGIKNVFEIASASDKVKCLVMGTVDLANDLHCLPNAPMRWNLMFSLQQVLVAARANNISALDGVYVDLNNDEGFEQECIQGRDLGFDGKTLIHPKTIEVANRVFSPSAAQIEHAHRVLQAHQDAIDSGSGVAVLDGKLVENLHVRDARRILQFEEFLSTKL